MGIVKEKIKEGIKFLDKTFVEPSRNFKKQQNKQNQIYETENAARMEGKEVIPKKGRSTSNGYMPR